MGDNFDMIKIIRGVFSNVTFLDKEILISNGIKNYRINISDITNFDYTEASINEFGKIIIIAKDKVYKSSFLYKYNDTVEEIKNSLNIISIENPTTNNKNQATEKLNSKNSSLLDILKVNDIRAENEKLKKDIVDLQYILTPEMKDVIQLKKKLDEIKLEIQQNENTLNTKINEIAILNNQIQEKKKVLIETDEKILMQEFGLYQPKYDFTDSYIYKENLIAIRDTQKYLIKKKSSATGNPNGTVNGSATQGKKMVADMQNLLIRAFNSECDDVISHVKYNNYEASLKRITSSKEAISKLGFIMGVAITEPYFQSKLSELTLALEYQEKKQEEKENQKAIREQMKEEAKLQKEIEEAKKKVEKEQVHYTNALSKINKQLETANEEQKLDLLAKKQEIEEQLIEIDKSLEDIDYREANQRAGYVYIISNIGSFGENIYKIGMTRRLEPLERIDELGNASVPFNFDVHGMIFSDNAPTLEASLHRAFENKKVNMVNQRREFFSVTLDEIKQVVNQNYDKTVEFVDIADAEQFRISQKMKKEIDIKNIK